MRLSPSTHSLAKKALDGEWSTTMVDCEIGDVFLSKLQELPGAIAYSKCVRFIAENAPVRITPGELIVGSATLQAAKQHILPITHNGKAIFGSTSHVTFGFDRVLNLGYIGIQNEILQKLTQNDVGKEEKELLLAMLECIEAANIWHSRYIELLEQLVEDDNAQWAQVLATARNVPYNPPETFKEAVQALWFLFCFQHLCGNWPGIGRFDQMLGGYLSKDLANNKVTIEEAREYVAHFWIKGAEWAGDTGVFGGSGDAQYYQNIILGGIDENGVEVTNEVTYLVLDVVEELHISDYPIAVRLNNDSPENLLQRIAQLQRLGGGIVSIYSENVVISALKKIGIPEKEARRYTNDGCWEPQIPGETCFIYNSIDILQALQNVLQVNTDQPVPIFTSFDSLFNAFQDQLARTANEFHRWADEYPKNCEPNFTSQKGKAVLASLMTASCIERGKGYYEHGANYNIVSLHAGGVADAANSLLVIKELVFERNELSLQDLVDILRANWEGSEKLRQQILREFYFYGNDSSASDTMAKKVLDCFISLVDAVPFRNGVYRTPGVSTFGREIAWRQARGATAAGNKNGEILASNFSPSPGTEKNGPTAAMKSYCAMGLNRLTGGAAMELKYHPTAIEGPAGLDALVSMMKTFVEMEGFYMQVDSISRDTLLDAQKDPNRYAGLAVRVSGWSARFITLDREWQEMIINRTEHC